MEVGIAVGGAGDFFPAFLSFRAWFAASTILYSHRISDYSPSRSRSEEVKAGEQNGKDGTDRSSSRRSPSDSSGTAALRIVPQSRIAYANSSSVD